MNAFSFFYQLHLIDSPLQPNFLNCPSSLHFNEKNQQKPKRSSARLLPQPMNRSILKAVYIRIRQEKSKGHWKKQMQKQHSDIGSENLARVLSVCSAKTSQDTLKFGRSIL